jgi:hypothetical protein
MRCTLIQQTWTWHKSLPHRFVMMQAAEVHQFTIVDRLTCGGVRAGSPFAG